MTTFLFTEREASERRRLRARRFPAVDDSESRGTTKTGAGPCRSRVVVYGIESDDPALSMSASSAMYGT